MKEILQTPEGRATVPPELVAHLVREFNTLLDSKPEGMWDWIIDQLATRGSWDDQMTKLGLKK